MKKVLGILVGLLVLGAVVGSAAAMPWWFYGKGYGFAVQKPKFGYMHGYGFAQGYAVPVLGHGPKLGYACPMWSYAFGSAPQQEIDFDEIKEKAEEILKDSEVKNGYIVKDNVIYGFLYENVSLAEVELGTPFVMMWFTTIPLEKDDKVVGFLRISNFELFGDTASPA